MRIRQTSRTPAILQEIGQRIERLRLQRNQSLADLAEAAGVGIATLQRFESAMDLLMRVLLPRRNPNRQPGRRCVSANC